MPGGSCSTGSAGGSGPARPGGTFRRITARGSRFTPVPPLAAGRHLEAGAVRAAGPRRRGRARDLGRLGGLGCRPGPPARRRARKNSAAQQEPPGGEGAPEPADHALGRSRGGLTTKFHLAAEQGQKPLAVIVTAGQRGDSPQFTVVLEEIRVPRPGGGRPQTTPDRVLADKAYGARANRACLRRRHIRATIPQQADHAAHRKRRGSAGGRTHDMNSSRPPSHRR